MTAVGASPVESVDRALVLLTALRDGEVLSVTDAAARLGVAPSTAHRLLTSLVHRDFAFQDRDRRYRRGPALLAPRSEPFTLSSVRSLAHPVLEQLHDRLGETVQIMVRHGQNIRFLDGIECELPLRVGVRVGDEMPAHCSAGGKAILAAMSTADLDRLYARGLPDWPTARYRDLSALKRHLTRVRRQGYGVNVEETEQGVSGVGVAVCDRLDRPIVALTVAVPSSRFARDQIDEMRDVLMSAADDFRARLEEGD
ncbi:MAG: IclR family transcriptional regulator [Actinobacteria bacterium]|nr:MAG: IclR family transcriptional regulator [Actinomycetota bacterium]HIE62212.1 IclR family transcriptional regulator [Microbacterium sp.]|tara:strand:- start:535 stop:1299 length:765 start_codon:yes stop_codon:yes gene_type:complete